MDKATQEGTAVGTEGNKKNIIDESSVKNNAVLSGVKNEAPNMTCCDPDAKDMMDRRSVARQNGDKLQGDAIVDALLQGGDQCVNNPTAPLAITVNTSSTKEEIADCTESVKAVDNQTQYFFRNLKLDVVHQDKIMRKRCVRKVKKCRIPYWGKHYDDHPECNEYYLETTSQTCDIDVDSDCTRILGWQHYGSYIVTIQNESTTLKGEAWVVDDPSAVLEKVRSNACNIVKTECVVGPETRYFYGTGFYRECFSQRVTVFCPRTIDETNDCSALRKKGCQQVSDRCIQKAGDGRCVKWTKRYRCPARSTEMVSGGHGGIHNIGGGSLIGQSDKFNDMAASLTQLQVLSEMQKEVQNITSQYQDVRVFKGQCNRCKKNVLSNVLYDCCAVQGLAMDLNLVDCNPEERQLAAMRGEGKCHYVGYIQNEFMGMWNSSYTHVYCCFPSPLIAHLQKEARKQLGKGFGVSTNPDCGGLSMDEIGRVDFAKMDLSPLFEDLLKKAKTNQSPLDVSKAKERMAQKIKDFKIDRMPPPGHEQR